MNKLPKNLVVALGMMALIFLLSSCFGGNKEEETPVNNDTTQVVSEETIVEEEPEPEPEEEPKPGIEEFKDGDSFSKETDPLETPPAYTGAVEDPNELTSTGTSDEYVADPNELTSTGTPDTPVNPEVISRTPADIVQTLQEAKTVTELVAILETVPAEVSLGDASLGGDMYKDPITNVAFLYETCNNFSGSFNFNSFIEELYTLGEAPEGENSVWNGVDYTGKTFRDVLNDYTGENYCDTPIFSYDDFKMCHTDFDREFVHNAVSVYLGDMSTSNMQSFLSSWSGKDMKENTYKDFFGKVLNGTIYSKETCFK